MLGKKERQALSKFSDHTLERELCRREAMRMKKVWHERKDALKIIEDNIDVFIALAKAVSPVTTDNSSLNSLVDIKKGNVVPEPDDYSITFGILENKFDESPFRLFKANGEHRAFVWEEFEDGSETEK